MPSQSNASRLIALFGGCTNTAVAIAEDKATVSRWTSSGRRGTNGHVPTKFNQKIMRAARKRGFPAQAKVFLCWKCPTCNGSIKDETA